MKTRTITAALLAAHLSGCAPSEPRSRQYFEAHIDEAREILDGCKEGSVRGAECDNAEYAVIRADAKAKSKKFWGDGKAYTPR